VDTPFWRSRRIWSAALNAAEAAAWAAFLWAVNDPATREYVLAWVQANVDAALLPMAASAASALLAYLSRRYPRTQADGE
jgi:hypothetical protein